MSNHLVAGVSECTLSRGRGPDYTPVADGGGTMASDVAVIGLGSMGYGMACSLLRAGHRTLGRRRGGVAGGALSRRGRPTRFGGGRGRRARCRGRGGAERRADRGRTVRHRGHRALPPIRRRRGRLCNRRAGLRPRRWRRVAARQASTIWTPRSPAARRRRREGRLSVMASGTPEAFAAARPVLDATAETVFELGDAAGAGSAMKAVNQLLAGVHIAAMAEAHDLRDNSGGGAGEIRRGDLAVRRHELDAGEPRAARRGRRLYAALGGRHLAEGPRHRARHRARGEVLGAADRRGAAAVPRRVRLRARARGRRGRRQGLRAERRADSAGDA